MLALAFSVLGALKVCTYLDNDPTAAGDDCAGTADVCLDRPDDTVGVCGTIPDDDGGAAAVQITCSDGSVKLQYHNSEDCSDDVSNQKCIIDLLSLTSVNPLSGCSLTSPLDTCTTFLSVGGIGEYHKYTGSCPGDQDDKPCFSRDARRAASLTWTPHLPPPSVLALTSRCCPWWLSGSR